MAILNLMRHSTGAVLGGGEKASQVAGWELRLLLQAHSLRVEDELSALWKCLDDGVDG